MRMRAQAGFSLVELLVMTAIITVVMAGVFEALNPSIGSSQAQPEMAGVQQWLRVGADALQRDLVMAGAGTYSGIRLGSLGNFFAPILPYRIGTINPDPPGTFRSDTITLMYIVPSAAQTSIRDGMPQPSAELKVNAQPGCPAHDQLCGFEEGMTVLIFDDTGSWDPFTITGVQTEALHLQHRAQDLSKAYQPGSYIAQLATHTYYLFADPATDTYQMRMYDGYQSELPVVDNVVRLDFEYFGDSQPPQLMRPVSDPVGPWTTYGPKPPALGVQPAGSTYPAGENCTFRVDGGLQVPRLTALDPTATGVVRLDPRILTDGPWCPDPTSANRFDADLLRVRQVRVVLRVQAGDEALRGAGGTLFARPGTARDATRLVPDQQIQFDVTPRNLNLGR